MTYEETEVDERCARCWCCSVCSTECAGRCGRGGGVEDQDEAALRALQLEKSISQRCDTKCCHTNVAADPTIIECDEDVMLWGKMFDCNWVIIGLDLGVGDLF